MKKWMIWLYENKDWLFGGIGLTIVSGILLGVTKIVNKIREAKRGEIKNKFIIYYNKIRGEQSKYSLLNINNTLFPTLNNELDVEYSYNESKNIPVQQYIYKIWSMDSRVNLLIEAEGGMGKTVSLMRLYDVFIKENIYIIYIPLHKLGIEKKDVLKEYIYNNVFDKEESINHRFFKSIANKKKGKERGKPELLLLLDGFNEVQVNNRENVIENIKEWMTNSCQLILTSRFDCRSNYGLINFDKITIQTLSKEQIKKYLSECELDFPSNKQLVSLLGFPMMLTLYAHTENYYSQYRKSVIVKWKEPIESSGAIIWNFLQCQIIKFIDISRTDNNKMDAIVAIEYLLPYICYKMELDEKFVVKEKEFNEWLEEGIQLLKGYWLKKIPDRIINLQNNLSCDNWEWNRGNIYKTLLSEFHLLIKDNDSYSLIHQNFRDCLASVYLIFSVSLHDEERASDLWDHKVFGEYIVNYISELSDEALILNELDNIRNKKPFHYILYNLIQILKKKNNNNLSSIDLSYLDLSKINLNDAILSDIQSTKFNFSYVNEGTFYPNGHQGEITIIKYLLGGQQFITGSEDGSIRIWDVKTSNTINLLDEHETGIVSLEYLQEDKILISASKDGVVIFWNADTGVYLKKYQLGIKLIKLIYSFKKSICICFLHEGYHKNAMIFKAADNIMESIPDINRYSLEDICLCMEERYLAVLFSEKILLINMTDLADTNVVFHIDNSGSYGNYIKQFTISPSSYQIAIVDNKGYLYIYDCHFNIIVNRFYLNKNKPLKSEIICAFSEDNKKILLAVDFEIAIWDIETGNELFRFYFQKKIESAIFSASNDECILGFGDGFIRVFNILRSDNIFNLFKNESAILHLAYSPVYKQCISGGSDGTINIWNLYSGGCYKMNLPFSHVISGIAQLPETKILLSSSFDGTVKMWDIQQCTCLKQIKSSAIPVTCLCVSTEKKVCLCGYENGKIEMWDFGNRRQVLLEGHSEPITCLAYSSKNDMCFSGSEGSIIISWDLKREKAVNIYNQHKASIHCIALFSNDNKIISSSQDGCVKIWDVKEHRCIKSFSCSPEGNASTKNLIQLIPNEPEFVHAYADKLYLTNTLSGKFIIVGKHDHDITAIFYSRKKMCCFCGDSSGKIMVWDIYNKKSKHVIGYHGRGITCLTMFDDKLVSGSADGSICIWELDNNSRVEIKIIPNMNIVGCSFINTKFEPASLKELVKKNGGIVN